MAMLCVQEQSVERPTIREVVEMLAQAKKPNAFQKQFILWGERKLARWKQRHLSFGGRVTLIQSTLSSIPIYFLSFFRLPRKVADNLIGIQRSFLWGGGSEQRKIAWTKWETIYLPKQKGGLGIKDIRTFNKVLLEKWRWDLFHQSKELWARILASKYGG